MEQSENERWGRFTEWTARIRFQLEADRGLYHDARDPEDGTPVEIKSCKRRTGRREDRGKFFIREENHERLRDADGMYVFVVYDPERWREGPILDVEMKPAAWLDSVDYGWTANGIRRGERVKRPPWSEVFADPEFSDDTAAATG